MLCVSFVKQPRPLNLHFICFRVSCFISFWVSSCRWWYMRLAKRFSHLEKHTQIHTHTHQEQIPKIHKYIDTQIHNSKRGAKKSKWKEKYFKTFLACCFFGLRCFALILFLFYISFCFFIIFVFFFRLYFYNISM